jgi:hypothetical protein
MLKFIDTYYEKITWSIFVIGLISLFAAKDYLSLVMFLYLLIRALKSRDSIRKILRTTPLSNMVIYTTGMIVLILVLVAIMFLSGDFIKKYNIPVFLQYIYIAVVLVGSMFLYAWLMDLLIKKGNKKR